MTAGVIGFESVSRGLEGREEEGEEEVLHSAGARFQVVMKKLGKRDATTKIKVGFAAYTPVLLVSLPLLMCGSNRSLPLSMCGSDGAGSE